VDVDEGIVEQAKSMGIHIIPRTEFEYVSAHLFQPVFLSNVNHRSDGTTNPTNKLPDEFQKMLKEFQGLFLTVVLSDNRWQSDDW
jgi:hypothetical protein